MLWIIWGILLLSGALLVMGLFCRPAAITAWLLHLACVKSSEVFYGMDMFLTIGLFYLMLAPLPDSHSLENRIWKSQTRDSRIVGFFRRVSAVAPVRHLFFQRPGEMSGKRLVEWGECLGRSDPSAL